ncbi:MAG: DUF362 domain-containing protein [Oscillospiraceae bacterium]|nr:DUF362 domain-containing protein [Oscillospiraceae bacterium]
MENKVYLAPCDGYEAGKVRKAVHDALSAFGGAESLAGGKRVLIKANLLMTSTPDKAVTTHPSVIKALAEEFIAAGCTVEIADSCGGIYTEEILKRLYVVSGMKRVADETGAVLNYDVSSFEREVPDGVRIKKVQLITPVSRADFIISAAKMKTHGFTYYTGAAKNMFGTIPGLLKAAMHSRFPDKHAFCEMLVDLCESVSPDLSIIDGVIGMEGAGPSGGSPKFGGVIVASESPYAADFSAMRIMGLSPERSPLHMAAVARGLVGDVVLEGAPVSQFYTSFEPAYKKETRTVFAILPGAARTYIERLLAAYPNVMKSKCVGCGECVRSCPESTIKLKEKKAQIDYKKCIRCYCCQEMCPARAIKIERFAKYRKRK